MIYISFYTYVISIIWYSGIEIIFYPIQNPLKLLKFKLFK